MPKRLRPLIKVFDDLGIEIVSIEATGSSHYKMTVEAKGTRRFFIASFSSSDRRSLLNFRGDVRRWINNIEGNLWR